MDPTALTTLVSQVIIPDRIQASIILALSRLGPIHGTTTERITITMNITIGEAGVR
jgi:hypothetical protein